MITTRRARIRGTVQGVGLRPFVARLAGELDLAGRVWNASGDVLIEVEGPDERLAEFERRLAAEAPGRPLARWTRPRRARSPRGAFRIESSERGAAGCVPVPPDRAPCAECLAEVDSEASRFAAYPFTSCTACGPRMSILREPPYDRVRTAMDRFPPCAACRREYRDPADRRCHAQAIACPACGPRLGLTDRHGCSLAHGARALGGALEALRRGAIAGLKGVGGFQLLADARNDAAVARLREGKRRPEKPFAVLFADVQMARRFARVGAVERSSLESAAAPIVLLERGGEALAPSVAPRAGRIGAMLPASPLHHLLATRFGAPVVATSGNLHDEPIAITEREARERLGGVADVFLTHDRPIVRRLDDSVVQVVEGRPRVLRMGRGLAPATVALPLRSVPLIATGGHLKSAPAAALGDEVVLWPHVGDLHSERARRAFEESVQDMGRFLGARPAAVATDRHPDYATTLWAEGSGLRLVRVQHHRAHVAACLAEHGAERALGVAWDGFGLGDDGGSWGGEFLELGPEGCARVASMHPFRVPGRDRAARDTWRSLAGAEAVAGGGLEPRSAELRRYAKLVRSPRLAAATTSVGRLFDAVAGLTGLVRHASFEGQAAMAVEDAAAPGAEPYPIALCGGDVDWRPAWRAMVAERGDVPRVASRFHATLVEAIVRVVEQRRARTVALAGGCFQNRLLLAGAIRALRSRGVRVLAPERVPPGDGGLALGQAWVAAHALARAGRA